MREIWANQRYNNQPDFKSSNDGTVLEKEISHDGGQLWQGSVGEDTSQPNNQMNSEKRRLEWMPTNQIRSCHLKIVRSCKRNRQRWGWLWQGSVGKDNSQPNNQTNSEKRRFDSMPPNRKRSRNLKIIPWTLSVLEKETGHNEARWCRLWQGSVGTEEPQPNNQTN